MKNITTNKTSKIVLFSLDKPQYALHLNSVERVINSVAITPLPKSPKKVLGIINMRGEIIPVIDVRKIFQLPSHDLSTFDQFIIAKTSKRKVALVVDVVNEVSELDNEKIQDAKETHPYADYIKGITIYKNNIILISDLEKFLSLDEETMLDKAINKIKS